MLEMGGVGVCVYERGLRWGAVKWEVGLCVCVRERVVCVWKELRWGVCVCVCVWRAEVGCVCVCVYGRAGVCV